LARIDCAETLPFDVAVTALLFTLSVLLVVLELVSCTVTTTPSTVVVAVALLIA
jgi:hypothetical protein